MKPLQIDFSGRSRLLVLNPSNPVQVACAGLVLIGAVLVMAGVGVALRLNTQSARLAQSISQIESIQRAKDETSAQIGQLSVEEAEAVNAAVMHLNYPWLEFFKGLEKHMQPGITLVSVETGMARQSSKIVIEASGIDEALSYVQAIKLEPTLSTVTLIKQESVVGNDNAAAMRFTLEAPVAAAPASAPAPRGSSS